jgi:hypothetical protein
MRRMSAEFDHAVGAIASIATEVEDAGSYSIAERRALDLMIDALSLDAVSGHDTDVCRFP